MSGKGWTGFEGVNQPLKGTRMGTFRENLEKKVPHRQDLAGTEHRTTNPVAPRRDSMAPGRRLLSLEEAASVLGLSPYSVRRLIWDGKLPAVRLTRRVQVDLRDVEKLIEQAKDRSGLGRG